MVNICKTYPTYLYPPYANKSNVFRLVCILEMYIVTSSTIISNTVQASAELAWIPNISGENLEMGTEHNTLNTKQNTGLR